MWKKILIGVGAVVLLVGSCAATWFFTNNAAQGTIERMTAEYATLQSQIDAMGEPMVAYTVLTTVEPGTRLTADMLTELSIPSKWITDDYCDLSDIIREERVDGANGEETLYVGQFAKTYINPGTPITKSILMEEKIPDTMREIDVVANRWPIGLKEGDYVDIRLTYPRGEDFIVLSHKRVFEVNQETLKLHMTEEEQHLYQAALVDYYLHLQNGADIYFTKYVEPGVQSEATYYYSVPQNIANVCLSDPNIVDRAMVTVRNDLLGMQTDYADPFGEDTESAGYIRSGRDRLNSAVNSDYNAWKNEYDQEKQSQESGSAAEDGSLLEDGGVN